MNPFAEVGHTHHASPRREPSNERTESPILSASDQDIFFMARALELARRGTPAPNPHVGAVVVRHGKIVGQGWHERAGTAHAEIVALQHAFRFQHASSSQHSSGLQHSSSLAAQATLYVTLEPCNHFGRTPPCVDALLRARITRVVIGCPDPNRLVLGGGAQRLRAAGIEVISGVLEHEARELIAPWAALLP